MHPPPGRIGLDLDRSDQARVTDVVAGSAAASAGLRAGDRLLRADGRAIATVSDLSQVLHDFAPAGGRLELEVARGDERARVQVTLDAGWKRGTPLDFSWRPLKWGFTPAPGFGGPLLDEAERRALGLAPDAFAFRVSYLVTWGDNRRYGAEAARAGIRNGDVFLAAAGERAFATVDHFHSWWRLTREPGDTVAVEVLRDGEPRTFEVRVLP